MDMKLKASDVPAVEVPALPLRPVSPRVPTSAPARYTLESPVPVQAAISDSWLDKPFPASLPPVASRFVKLEVIYCR
jgi:hypothetical protein